MDPITVFATLSPAAQARLISRHFAAEARRLSNAPPANSSVLAPAPAVEDAVEEAPVAAPTLHEHPGASLGEIGIDNNTNRRNARARMPVWPELTIRCGSRIQDTDVIYDRLTKNRNQLTSILTVLERTNYAPMAATELVRQIREDEALRAPFETWRVRSELDWHIYWHLDRLAYKGAVSVNI